MTEEKTGQDMAGQSDTTLGKRLQARRRELGWSLEEVESSLRLRRKILQAIEGERYSELPDKVYALGFIKSYARFLGLDDELVLSQARKELASFVPKRQMVNLELPGPQEGRSAGIWILLAVGLLVIAGGYAGWYHFYARDSRLTSAILPQHLADKGGEGTAGTAAPAAVRPSTVPEQQTGTQPDAGEQPAGKVPMPPAEAGADKSGEAQKDVPDLPPPPEAAVPDTSHHGEDGEGEHGASTRDDAVKAPAASAGPASSTPATPVPAGTSPAGASSSSPRQDTPASALPASTPAPVKKTESPAPASAPAQVGKEAGDIVSIHALEDSWVHVVDGSGTSLIGHVLKKGEVWRGVAGATYHITSGNAGGVVLQAGNVVSAPLGLRGRVAHDVVVNAALVEQGRYGHGALPAGVARGEAHH